MLYIHFLWSLFFATSLFYVLVSVVRICTHYIYYILCVFFLIASTNSVCFPETNKTDERVTIVAEFLAWEFKITCSTNLGNQ